jgi:hypothetical protein
MASIGQVDARRIYRDHSRDRASQSRATGARARLTMLNSMTASTSPVLVRYTARSRFVSLRRGSMDDTMSSRFPCGDGRLPRRALDLIRFGGHLPKGGYDVHNGGNEKPTASSAVHG